MANIYGFDPYRQFNTPSTSSSFQTGPVQNYNPEGPAPWAAAQMNSGWSIFEGLMGPSQQLGQQWGQILSPPNVYPRSGWDTGGRMPFLNDAWQTVTGGWNSGGSNWGGDGGSSWRFPQPRPEPSVQPLYGVAVDPRPRPEPPVQPLYGVAVDPNYPSPNPQPPVQPLYGVAVDPNDPSPTPQPPVQPLYGVAVDPTPFPNPQPPVQPLYGVAVDPNPRPRPRPEPPIQPLYGVAVDPRPRPEPPVQPLYGVAVDPRPQPPIQPLYGVAVDPYRY